MDDEIGVRLEASLPQVRESSNAADAIANPSATMVWRSLDERFPQLAVLGGFTGVARRTGRVPQLVDPRSRVNCVGFATITPLGSIRWRCREGGRRTARPIRYARAAGRRNHRPRNAAELCQADPAMGISPPPSGPSASHPRVTAQQRRFASLDCKRFRARGPDSARSQHRGFGSPERARPPVRPERPGASLVSGRRRRRALPHRRRDFPRPGRAVRCA